MDTPFVWPEEPTNWEPWGEKQLEEPRPIDKYAGGKKKEKSSMEKEETRVRNIKQYKKEAVSRQAELAKERLSNGSALPKISYSQAVNRPDLKIKI